MFTVAALTILDAAEESLGIGYHLVKSLPSVVLRDHLVGQGGVQPGKKQFPINCLVYQEGVVHQSSVEPGWLFVFGLSKLLPLRDGLVVTTLGNAWALSSYARTQ